ncbi:MAG: PPC domain-containing DNA-binding protein [Halobacteria archaeon]
MDKEKKYREVQTGNEYILRLENGRDWRRQIEEVAEEQEIDSGWFNGMGAAKDAELWFYDQSEKEYFPLHIEEPTEVAMAVGNISFLDGERFAHTHVLLTDGDSNAFGGHLNHATAFAGEVYIREFDHRIEREHDPQVTDLDLWSDGSLE